MAQNAKKKTLAQKINVMRAAVMGANDGIVSVAGIVIGVAGATSSNFAIFISGISGMLAGTVSMAMGEFVSVNTQKDSQRNAISHQKQALADSYDHEFNTVQQKLVSDGITADLAEQATKEMMNKDPLKTSVRQKYGFNVGEYTNPLSAAIASMISFPTGSILPLVAITTFPSSIRVLATGIAVIIALAITGYSAAKLGNSNTTRGIIRNVVSGILTMIVTYTIGTLIGS
ncbi:VIT family protein [Lentilactobacillus parafarraginis]|jgi:VIT1/CCC1 family predicted Fe2+/Mn2+ transporter|uniref:VIT family protein n=2 Tax=Lentilactobacillus parafarraginis TaxID=390842 RepID=A0A5R9CYJ5_9LACO|nr:VIT family protein [Lentilactobacillus parafarraginis]EHM00034.1 membrane protein [Lentilactobacillus parafarraginis F0439]TLQ20213.1 VIT family protein [Lentilactobacillus parafarraginis]